MEYGELKKLWQCNDKIAEENFMRLKELELDTHLTPAVLSYEASSISIWHLRCFQRDSGRM